MVPASDSGPPLTPKGLASDFGPPLRPKGLAEEEQRSLPTLAHLSDWKAQPTPLLTPTRVSDRGCTEPLLTTLL